MPSAILISTGFPSQGKVSLGFDCVAVIMCMNQHDISWFNIVEGDGQVLLVFLHALFCGYDLVNLTDLRTIIGV